MSDLGEHFAVYIDNIEDDPDSLSPEGTLGAAGGADRWRKLPDGREVAAAISGFANQVLEQLATVATPHSNGFTLDTVEINASAVFDGKVSIKIIEGKAGVANSVKLIFKRNE